MSLVLATVFLGGCSVSRHQQVWQSPYIIANNTDKLQIGDILITPKDWKDPLSWWGHSALVVDASKNIGEYPKLGYGYFAVPLYYWLKEDKEVIILRYKKLNPIFKARLKYNLKLLEKFNYGISYSGDNLLMRNPTKDDISLYCSSYIWYAYAKTAKDLGFSLNIDSDGGAWIMPYDFLDSKHLSPIKF